MTIPKIFICLVAFLLLVVAVEFGLIYILDVNATVLQSLKYIVPVAVAVSLLLAVFPLRKRKATRKGRTRHAST